MFNGLLILQEGNCLVNKLNAMSLNTGLHNTVGEIGATCDMASLPFFLPMCKAFREEIVH